MIRLRSRSFNLGQHDGGRMGIGWGTSAAREPETLSWVAPRARVEQATYRLGGTPALALPRPVKTHITEEQDRDKQSLPKTISRRASS